MSLITRCPACGTMFKVVTDQLKVSQGWVRCGQCTEVFNASVYLQPHPAVASAAQPNVQAIPADENFPGASALQHETPAPVSAFAANPADGHSGPVVEAGSDSADDQDSPSRSESLHAPVENPFDPETERRFNDAKALEIAQESTFEVSSPWVAAPLPPEAAPETMERVADEATAVSGDDISSLESDESEASASETPDEQATDDVSFVRDARRKAFWRKPVVRLVLGMLVLVFAGLLFVQAVVQHKDSLLAHEPRLKPLLLVMCAHLQCELAPLRQIDAMVIDSSSFNKLGDDSFRLSFTLKNTASGAVALPALEVTLTDTQDQALIRRVLMPAQFGAAEAAVLGAGQDFSGLVVLQVPNNAVPAADAGGAQSASASGPLRVAGYRLLAFYP